MRIGSLFSGYGGADLAVRSMWPQQAALAIRLLLGMDA